MTTLRSFIDGSGIMEESDKPLIHHLRKAATAKVDYDVARSNLQSKLAPMQKLMELTQQMHGPTGTSGPNPQDPNDPFQNPYMQEGQGGPGGVGQGMENQDDLARTGQMVKPSPGGVDNYLKKGANGAQPGKPTDDGNKRLEMPGSRLAQGKPQQRSTSGNRPPGKVSQATEGKPAKKGKKIKLEISDDSLKADAIKNGMKRCATCKNFFNPAHPKAGRKHCPDCKQGSMRASHRHKGLDAAMTTLRGRKVKTTGDYHDDSGVSMPSVAVGLSAALTSKQRTAMPGSEFAIPRLRKLPIGKPGNVRNALSRVNQTKGATPGEKQTALAKIRRKASSIGVADQPTSKQRSWLHKKTK